MNKILSFDKFNLINENFDFYSDGASAGPSPWFQQWQQLGAGPTSPMSMGPSYGFVSDPNMSVYSDTNNPYVDNYARMSGQVGDITKIMRGLYSQGVLKGGGMPDDEFLNDMDEFKNLKILRIYENSIQKLDVFISFEFKEDEFFGVFKNFNDNLQQPRLKSDFLLDPRQTQLSHNYYLKLNNFFLKTLENWFTPCKGLWRNIKENAPFRNNMGNIISLKTNSVVEVIGNSKDKDGNPYISVKYNGEILKLIKNNYYFFKYWFEKN